MPNRSLWVGSGIAGVVAVSIVYSYGLYGFVAAERESTANRLAFVFAVTMSQEDGDER